MKKYILIVLLSIVFTACNNNTQKKEEPQEAVPKTTNNKPFKNKGHELVYNLTKLTGNYNTLLNKKDVVYTYTYETPDGNKDISTEKYIFNGEYSYGLYHQHQRTLPHLDGPIEQGFDGKNYWLKHKGKYVTDKDALKRVAFNRPTNFYWFAMMPKLLDLGLNYEYKGEKTIESNTYDIVKISFNSENDKPTDIYQIYINQATQLVDQFLFTVADFGVTETPNLMQLQYEKIDDIVIPTIRQYKKSDWNATVTEDPWIKVNWTDIKFNNNLKKELFIQQ